MKEKDVRDRISEFLKKTARTVAVPASMGLGLSGAGCDQHALQGKASDAGPDLAAQTSDAATVAPDLADVATDLPQMMVPYLVAMPPDVAPDLSAADVAAADVAADLLDVRGIDADRDVSEVLPDVGPDLRLVAPPYMVPPLLEGEALGARPGIAPGPLAAPEKK